MTTLHKTGIAFATYFKKIFDNSYFYTLKSGKGFPRQRLLRDQVPCLTVLLLVALLIILTRGSSPPDLVGII